MPKNKPKEMSFIAPVIAFGRVTIPHKIRKELDIEEDSVVEVKVRNTYKKYQLVEIGG